MCGFINFRFTTFYRNSKMRFQILLFRKLTSSNISGCGTAICVPCPLISVIVSHYSIRFCNRIGVSGIHSRRYWRASTCEWTSDVYAFNYTEHIRYIRSIPEGRTRRVLGILPSIELTSGHRLSVAVSYLSVYRLFRHLDSRCVCHSLSFRLPTANTENRRRRPRRRPAISKPLSAVTRLVSCSYDRRNTP